MSTFLLNYLYSGVFVGRKKHAKKEIEEAIQYAENVGWRYREAGGSAHAWGRLLCPFENRDGCSLSIWSTPKSSEVHARQIRRKIASCPHTGKEESL